MSKDIHVEEMHNRMINWMEYFFTRYELINSLLAYIIHNDYGGVFMISEESWENNIVNHNFSTRFQENDGVIYFQGEENS